MGLDLSHGDFYVSYTSFGIFRREIAKLSSVEYPEGHGQEIIFPYDMEEYKANNPGLVEFFLHSDCDGEIKPELCENLAIELKILLPKIVEERIKELCKQFIDACKEAAECNEPLKFL